jgi:GST-like protein
MAEYVVHGAAGSGSVAVEAALTLIGAPYSVKKPAGRTPPFGGRYTPVGQVPGLVTPTGELITESAAILIWLAETHPEARLAPLAGEPERAAFLRWMSFVSANIYAHYWARDFPVRVVDSKLGQKQVKARLEARIAACWGVMEAGLRPTGPYLLGEDLTVLDIYVTVVGRWTPRKALHEIIAPGIAAVIRRIESEPRLAEVWAKRFPLRFASPGA